MRTYSEAYPIIFTINDLVLGCDYLARFTASGRALMVREDDNAWWLYGVEPSGLADSGDTPQEAFLRFLETFKKALSDFASDAPSFDGFEKRVQAFFQESNSESKSEWERALEGIRSGLVTPPPPFSLMPRQPGNSPCFISISQQSADSLTFSANRNETAAIPTAA